MRNNLITGPPEEQQICVTCGICCDATLFLHAHLNPGERGQLPDKIEQAAFREDGKDYFMLPCNYFSGKCTIYDQKRADVCSSYRCQLLKDFAAGNIPMQDALESVREVMVMREEIEKEYRRISGNCNKISFRQILKELGKIQKSATEEGVVNTDFDLLLAKCNIFEALQIKHFRSTEDFEKMIMK